jgi:hypothetical protein
MIELVLTAQLGLGAACVRRTWRRGVPRRRRNRRSQAAVKASAVSRRHANLKHTRSLFQVYHRSPPQRCCGSHPQHRGERRDGREIGCDGSHERCVPRDKSRQSRAVMPSCARKRDHCAIEAQATAGSGGIGFPGCAGTAARRRHGACRAAHNMCSTNTHQSGDDSMMFNEHVRTGALRGHQPTLSTTSKHEHRTALQPRVPRAQR